MPQFDVQYKIRDEAQIVYGGRIRGETQEDAQQTVGVEITSENPAFIIIRRGDEHGIIIPKRNIIAAYVTLARQQIRTDDGGYSAGDPLE